MPEERELERLAMEMQAEAEEHSNEPNLGEIEELTDKINFAEELKKEAFFTKENSALRRELGTLRNEHRKLAEAYEREMNRARMLEGQVLDLEQVIRSLKKRNEALENELSNTAVETAPEETEE